MANAAVSRPIEREYRNVISDNRRWNGFVERPGDIFVCTPAKCGTTWMQTIVASLTFPDGNPPGPVMEIAPWIDARFENEEEILARLDAQTHRRSVKSHTPSFNSSSRRQCGSSTSRVLAPPRRAQRDVRALR